MARLGGSTVYDRLKKTGYITGPKHAMLGQQADTPVPLDAGGDPGGMGPDDPDVPGSDAAVSGGPPNLRDAQVTPDSCADCGHFNGRDQCMKFNTNVTPNEVCD